MMGSGNTYIKSLNVQTRPNANDGAWLMLLLPVAIITSAFTLPIVLTPTYKLCATLCVGLISSSLAFLYQYVKNSQSRFLNALNFFTIIVIFHFFMNQDWIFAIISSIFATLYYPYQYLLILKKFPLSFTIGECGLITQAMVLLLYTTGLNLVNSKGFLSNMQISTIIIQIGLLGVGIIALVSHIFKIKTSIKFYITSAAIIFLVIFFPLHVLLKRSPILWILELMFYDITSVKVILYWSLCSGLAVLAVSKQIFNAQKATTSQRKVFHILAVSVFVPGLLFTCSFLYLASGVILGIFFALEILRILNIPPVGDYLQDGFSVFSDEKDTGIVAFTPIYLLAGCSLPLWLHPAPCDVTDSAIFNLLPLLSGILTIGIGDTAASIFGSKFGKHKWRGSNKSIEGTVACAVTQGLFIILLAYLEYLQNVTTIQYVKTAVAVIVTSIVEAKTTQVDNLVLPLIMYIILIL